MMAREGNKRSMPMGEGGSERLACKNKAFVGEAVQGKIDSSGRGTTARQARLRRDEDDDQK